MSARAIIAAIAGLVALCNTARAQPALPLPEYDPQDFAGKQLIFYGSTLGGVQAYAGFPQAGLTAIGTNQATAYDLTTSPTGQVVAFGTVPSGTGVALNDNFPLGGWQVVVNEGGNALEVYPPIGSGGSIDGGSANAGIAVAKSVVIQRVSALDWRTIGAGGGASGSGIPATTVVLCGTGTAGAAQACTVLTGLSSTGGALSVLYGTTGGTALQGSLRGAANGVAELDGSQLLPLAELPAVIPSGGVVLCEGATVNAPAACTSLAGLSSTGGALSVLYGTAIGTALQGSLLGAASGVAPLDAGARVAFANLPASVQTVGLTFGFAGVPAASTLRQQVLPYSCNLPANMGGSQSWENILATGAPAFAVAYLHAGSPTTVGSVTCSSSSHTCALPTSSSATLVAGDVVQVTSPASVDATAADLTFTVVCARQ